MLKTRILLVAGSALVIWLLFMLPKVVVNNEADELDTSNQTEEDQVHAQPSAELAAEIASMRAEYQSITEKEKSAIFADSLAKRYLKAEKFDSAAWFAEEAAAFFNTTESWANAGEMYYQAYTFALDQAKQAQFSEKARSYFGKVLESDPSRLDIKAKIAMTYLGSSSPMQGIMMLREVLEEDPENQDALFYLGMLSVQSGQNDNAIERLEKLISVNQAHIQGQLLLGVALMNTGQKERARAQFEKVKQLDKDPAIQAAADSYLKDLK